MWDESLPSYTGSFEDNVILFTLYFKLIVYYLVLIFGAGILLLSFLAPFFGFFLSYKSIIIKFKKEKKHKKHTHKDDQQKLYLDMLDKKIKKKKKH